MNVEDLTIREAKKLVLMFSSPRNELPSHSFNLGEQLIVRTVTHYYTGRLTRVTDSDIILEDATWIADTGRWTDALTTGKVNECEPFIDPVVVSRGAIVDFTKWRGALPKAQK